jgi:hypothetical protein
MIPQLSSSLLREKTLHFSEKFGSITCGLQEFLELNLRCMKIY